MKLPDAAGGELPAGQLHLAKNAMSLQSEKLQCQAKHPTQMFMGGMLVYCLRPIRSDLQAQFQTDSWSGPGLLREKVLDIGR